MITQIILKFLLAVGALLECRPDITGALERIPAVNLCVTDDTREMGEAGTSTA
jgi:hypothetical protein